LVEVHAALWGTFVIGKVIFIIAGIICINLGLISALIVVVMFQHPGGIGVEKLVGPVVGLVALGFFAGGVVCLYVPKRLDKLIKNSNVSKVSPRADRNLLSLVDIVPHLTRALRVLATATVIGMFFSPGIIDSSLLCLLIFLSGLWAIMFPPGIIGWAKAAHPELDPWDESMWWIPRLVGSGFIAISIVIGWILFLGS
jgi:uncharacterized membrane protein